MATTSKSEKIIVGIDNQIIDLTGADKEAFLEQRLKDQEEIKIKEEQLKSKQTLRLSALQKLGLTEEEINAIL